MSSNNGNGAAQLPAVQNAADRVPVKITERGLQPSDLDGLWRVATMFQKSGLAPKAFDSPEKIAFVLAAGAELGMSCGLALRSMALINGRLGLFGDGLVALVMSSGLCEQFEESYEGAGEDFAAVCTVRRKGIAGERTETFSVADAKKAGLWGKTGPWTQYPKRMLRMRARSFALRDLFGDVLGGMKLVEELRDTPAEEWEPAPAARHVNRMPAAALDPEPEAQVDQRRLEGTPEYERFEAELAALADDDAYRGCWQGGAAEVQQWVAVHGLKAGGFHGLTQLAACKDAGKLKKVLDAFEAESRKRYEGEPAELLPAK